eukprot:1195094-Prymnesium_polylepis.1
MAPRQDDRGSTSSLTRAKRNVRAGPQAPTSGPRTTAPQRKTEDTQDTQDPEEETQNRSRVEVIVKAKAIRFYEPKAERRYIVTVQGADTWIHRDEGHSHASRNRPFRAVVVQAHS